MKAIIQRDVVLDDTAFTYSDKGEDTKTTNTIEVKLGSIEASRPVIQNQCPERQRRPSVWYKQDEFADTNTENVLYAAYNICKIMEPKTMHKALTSEQTKEMKAATDSEFDSLMANETWELLKYPVVKNQ